MMRFSVVLLLVGLALGVTLAVVVGVRLSEEAVAVIVGVMAGVAASIPTSLIVVWFALRELGAHSPRAAYVPPAHRQPETEQPSIVVVNSPPAYASPLAEPPPSLVRPRAPRQFAVIGGLDDTPLGDPQG